MRSLLCLLVALVALSVCAAPVLAEAEHKEEPAAKEGGKIDVAEKFGLKRYDLGIYTLIVFGILVFLLGRFAWGPMMAGLDKREATLRQTHEEADAAREEARLALAEVQARLAKTNEEIRGMLDEARR